MRTPWGETKSSGTILNSGAFATLAPKGRGAGMRRVILKCKDARMPREHRDVRSGHPLHQNTNGPIRGRFCFKQYAGMRTPWGKTKSSGTILNSGAFATLAPKGRGSGMRRVILKCMELDRRKSL